jgi:hypothetical protein
MRRVLAALLVAVLAMASAAPAAAEDGYVDVFINAKLDAPAYLPSDFDTVRLSIYIRNQGTAPATGVVVRTDGNLDFAPWEGLDESGPGIELGAGASVELTLTAKPTDPDMLERLEVVTAEPDVEPANNRATLEAFLTEKQADLSLTVHYDADGDKVIDAGETRAGVTVSLSGGLDSQAVETRTDAAGVAHFPGIAGGQYNYKISLPAGWYTDVKRTLKVRGGTNDLVARATYFDLAALVPSIELDRDTYAADDIVRERVTLTNTGTTDLAGIVANCGQAGIRENVLSSLGWGDLAPVMGSPGVVVRAGETRTWEFSEPVPPRSWEYGFVSLRCHFSPLGWGDGPAVVDVRADVPGGFGTVRGMLVDEDDRALSGVTVLMVHLVTGETAARAESDGAGRFQFPVLPADLYELRPVGPWRLRDAGMFPMQVMAEWDRDFKVVLMPSPTWLDPDDPPPTIVEKSTVDTPAVAAQAPTPQASPRPANLADTGADVVELTVLGLLLVLAGSGLLLARRFVS